MRDVSIKKTFPKLSCFADGNTIDRLKTTLYTMRF